MEAQLAVQTAAVPNQGTVRPAALCIMKCCNRALLHGEMQPVLLASRLCRLADCCQKYMKQIQCVCVREREREQQSGTHVYCYYFCCSFIFYIVTSQCLQRECCLACVL